MSYRVSLGVRLKNLLLPGKGFKILIFRAGYHFCCFTGKIKVLPVLAVLLAVFRCTTLRPNNDGCSRETPKFLARGEAVVGTVGWGYWSWRSASSFTHHAYSITALLHTVCVCVFSSHPFWTSMDVPAGDASLVEGVRGDIWLAFSVPPSTGKQSGNK